MQSLSNGEYTSFLWQKRLKMVAAYATIINDYVTWADECA